MVELTVYAGDSVAFGRLALTADRVTDLMNDRTEFEFVDTFLQSLDDGHGLLVRTVIVARDEIFAVAVAGPRGDPARRHGGASSLPATSSIRTTQTESGPSPAGELARQASRELSVASIAASVAFHPTTFSGSSSPTVATRTSTRKSR